MLDLSLGILFCGVTSFAVVPLACVVLLSVTFLLVADNKLALDLVQSPFGVFALG